MFSANKITPVSAALVLTVSVILMLAAYAVVKPSVPPNELQGVLRQDYKPLQPIRLIDQSSIPFDDQRFIDKWSIVFFGYLSCPDVCPTTLHELNRVESQLKQEIGSTESTLQIVFVSVDPDRDSTKKIGEYINFFNSEFVGVTGTKNELDELTRQFGAGYIIEEELTPGQYNVAHTSALFLVDPLGRLVASFSQPHHAKTISTQLLKIMDYLSNS